jgi:hypothetical protein
MTCPLCNDRPARRHCPALRQTICPVCCGTRRLVEIPCPDDCPYLASARRHPPAIAQRQHELDVALMLPAMSGFTDRQSRFFFVFQSILARHPEEPLRPLLDEDVADAAASVAGTLETAARGVIYEQRPASLTAQDVAAALRQAFDEIAGQFQGPRTPLERDAARALRGIEEAARRVGPLVGDARKGFLGLVGRVMKGNRGTGGQGNRE